MSIKFLVMSLPSILMIVFIFIAIAIAQKDQPDLKLVNVVFRHGDRTPLSSEQYPNDPHRNLSFYPMGHGALTNTGKLRAFSLGEELKRLYDNFLGSIYEPSALMARSTNYDITKMSLQLVLSGLYPPAAIQKWNDKLLWQPIPVSYRRLSEDILFAPDLCPKYLAELDRVKSSQEIIDKIAGFDDVIKYLKNNTGRLFENISVMVSLYDGLTAEAAMNLKLPDWTIGIFPSGRLFDVAVFGTQLLSYTEDLRRLNGGMFVRKISEDLTAYRNGTLPTGRRVYLYSGHKTNIGALLIALGVYNSHVPEYSSAIMIELWKLKDEYFVKVLYYLGIPSTVKTMTIPGCEELCPLDTFLKLIRSVTPSDSDLICVKKDKASAQNTPSSLLDV